MTGNDHNKILGIGFAVFAVIFFFTFLLLLVVTPGVFVALGISFANESGDSKQAGIGILGGVLTVVFYGGLGLIFVLPTALASWKMLKRRKRAPLGTILGVYGLWFFFSAEDKHFYSNYIIPSK